MKRIIALALLAMMVFGATAANAATTFKASGQYDFAWGWTDNLDYGEDDGEDDFSARQRFRFNASFIQGEHLAGYANFEIGDFDWGRGAGALGTQDLDADNTSLELRHMYIDFFVPNTDLMFRVGRFDIETQSAFGGSAIMDDSQTGILASYNVNDNVSVLAFWSRIADLYSDDNNPAATDTADNDEVDAFGVLVPVKYDNISATPFFIYTLAGADSEFGFGNPNARGAAGANADFDDAYAWWLGTSLVVNFDQITFAGDVNYGYAEFEDATVAGEIDEASGWYAGAKLSYAFDMATPAILGWYATGDDKDDVADGESGLMPTLSPAFGATDMLFDGGNTRTGGKNAFGGAPQGTWGIGFEIADISFVEGLTHTARIVYVAGTNDIADADATNTYLSEDDSLVEINFNHEYQVYDNLALLMDMGYVAPDFDDDARDDEAAYRVSVGLSYKF